MYKLEKIDTNKVQMEIEVPVDEVNEALDQAYKKVVKDVSIPGFRKGKVPRKVLESRLGPEVLYNEALEILVDPAYIKAVEESQIEPISQPEMELVQIEKDKPLIFKVTVDVKPEVELPEYKGVTVEKVKKEITQDDIDRYLNSLLEQHTRLISLEEGEIQEKDLAIIDFKGTVDGEPFEGGEAENYSLEIGSKTFVEGFEEQLIGVKKGETKEIRVTFPEDYSNEELAGKEAVFQVTVNEIKRPQLPELNDDFIQEISEEFNTVEEFTADVENKLKEDLEGRQKYEIESKIIEKIAAESEMEIPEALVEREIDNQLSEMDYYLRMQGFSLDQYIQMVEGGKEKLREEYRDEAVKKVRGNLVLDAIIKKEGFEATEEDVNERISSLAQSQNASLEDVKERLQQDGRIDMISHEIRYRKAIDMLVENANIVEVEEEEKEEEQLNQDTPASEEQAEKEEKSE